MELLKLTSSCSLGGHHKLVTDNVTGEECCARCGIVISDKVFVSDDQSNYGEGPSKSQHSAVTLQMGEKGLGSVITRSGASSAKLINTTKYLSIGKTNTKALVEFSKVSDKLNVPEYIIEDAIKNFIELRKKGLLKGRDMRSILGAITLVFCKRHGLNMTFKTVSDKLIINRKTLFAYCKEILELLKLDSSYMRIILPVDYVEQICSKLDIEMSIKRKCFLIIEEMQKSGLHVGKNPLAVAACGIYLGSKFSNKVLSQKDLSYASGISEVTIRNITRTWVKKYN